MAVFRVEKNRGYTVMSNHHLRNPDLTLKAKGLLSQMLSLPENWDYTLKGLSSINKESIDAIRTAVWELEKSGYNKTFIREKPRGDTERSPHSRQDREKALYPGTACTGQKDRKRRPEEAGGKEQEQGIGGIGAWDNSTLRKQTLSAVTGRKQGLTRWRQ